MTSRRDPLLAGCTLALLLAAPLASDAQRLGKVWRIAWLGEGADPGAANVAARLKPEGILALQDTVTFLNRDDTADFALRHRVPAASPAGAYVDSGGFVAYGPDLPAVGKRAAYVLARADQVIE